MPSRQELIDSLRRQDLIDKLKESDGVDWEAEATRKAEEKYEADRPSSAQSAAFGATQGIMRDWGDEAYAAVKSALTDESYEDARSRSREKFRRAEVDNPSSYGAGYLGGSLASSPFTASPLGAAAVGGVEGSVRSLGRADELDQGALEDAAGTGAVDAALGGTFAKVANKAGDYVSEKSKKIYDYLRNKAGNKASESFGGTQRMMERAGDKMPEIGKYALDNKILTPFGSNQSTFKNFQRATRGLEDEMNPIYDAASKQSLTRDDLANMIEGKINEANMDAGTVDLATKFQKHKDDVNSAAREYYNPSDLRNYRRSFDRKIKDFNKKGESSGEQAAQDMRWGIREKEMDLIDQYDPLLRQKNEDLFNKYHLASLGKEMAGRGAARSSANNGIGLTSYIVGAGAAGAGGGLVAAGAPPEIIPLLAVTGTLGREISRRYGKQMTAHGINKLSSILGSPRYANIFKQAASRGGSAVAVTHQMLLDKDPEYRKMIEETLSEGASE